MGASCSTCALLGRLGLALCFLFAGVNKLFDWENASHLMTSKGLTFVPILLGAAALVEILGSVLLIIGYKTRIAAGVLFFFLISVSVIFHDFWNVEGVEKGLQQAFFFRNIAIAGGLLYVISYGAGSLSIDHLCCKQGEEKPKL